MIDKRQQSIKERLRRFAMDLWNITDLRQVDPVIDLILDVIAYNSSRLHQNISDSDSSVLHRFGMFVSASAVVTSNAFSCFVECGT